MKRPKPTYRKNGHRRRRSKTLSFSSILLTLLFFSFIFIIISRLPNDRIPDKIYDGQAFVIDGDTVVLNKTHIRLVGIDAPEIAQRCSVESREFRCGLSARDQLRNKIGKQAIRCKSEGTDKYGRVLARCYLRDTDLNQWMVQQGWAVSYGDYHADETVARTSKQGIWAGSFDRPAQWRKVNNNATPIREQNNILSDTISRMIIAVRGYVAEFFD